MITVVLVLDTRLKTTLNDKRQSKLVPYARSRIMLQKLDCTSAVWAFCPKNTYIADPSSMKDACHI